jgi:hypothetical protein
LVCQRRVILIQGAIIEMRKTTVFKLFFDFHVKFFKTTNFCKIFEPDFSDPEMQKASGTRASGILRPEDDFRDAPNLGALIFSLENIGTNIPGSFEKHNVHCTEHL